VKTKPKGLDKPSTVTVIKVMSALNTWLYRRTGGRVGRTWRLGSAIRKGVPICLLTTTGRKSGTPRTVPLCFLADGDRVVLVASQGGLPDDPQWYKNLLADPAVDLQVGATHRRMTARTAEPAERAQLWPRLVDLYADYDSYQRWTGRTIPVVVCDPA
jgi:deazaflavin-dependent oxidoreductase (nitroreductase family)